MRLPQSSSRLLSFRKIPVNIFIAIAAVLVGTNAWAQQLVTSPTILTFGVVAVGQSQTEVVTLTNTGSTSVNVSEVRAVGNEFSVSGITTPLTLAAGESTTMKVTFAPASTGWVPGRILFVSNASNSYYRLPLGGGGVTTEAVTASPSTMWFGSVTVGKSETKPLVVTNGRSSTVTLTSFVPSGSQFSITNGPNGPVTLNPGESITVGVTFTPTAAGLTGGSILVRGPTINIPVNGAGTIATSTPPPPPPTVGQLTISPSPLSFGSVQVGTTATKTSMLTATGGSVTVSSISSNNVQFAVAGATFPITVPSGQSVPVSVTYTPTGSGAASGTLAFVNNGSTTTITDVASGTGTTPPPTVGQLSISPSPLSFGSVQVGTTATKTSMLTATGGSVTVSSISSNNVQFSISGATFPITVPSGQSVPVTVTYTPTGSGAASGTLAVVNNGSNTTITDVASGTGTTPTPTVGQLTISPSSLSFGSVQVGTTVKDSPVLTATGGSVTISSVSSSNGQFAIAGATFPMTIPSGQSVSLNVTYTPTSSGSASGTLSFVNNGSATVTEAASGSGSMPYVTLSWSPSSSAVSGYNIYRGTTPGSYAKVNPSVNATTSFTDNSVTPGTTYYYAATSVSASGEESGYSSPITVTIP